MDSASRKNCIKIKPYRESHFCQSLSGLMILFILGFYVLYPINLLRAEGTGESQTNSSEEKQKDDKKDDKKDADKTDKKSDSERKDDSSHESDSKKDKSDPSDDSSSKKDADNRKDSAKDSNNDNKKSNDADHKSKHEEPKKPEKPEQPKHYGDNSNESSAKQSDSASDSNDSEKNNAENSATNDNSSSQEPENKPTDKNAETDEAAPTENKEQPSEIADDIADSASENTENATNPSGEFQDRYESSPLGDQNNSDSGSDSTAETAGSPSATNENSADVENETGSVANTGNNIVQNSETDSNSTIASGDGTANANTVTESNVTIVGDNYLESVVNIDGQKVGDIDLMAELQKVLNNNAGPILLSQNADGSYTIINRNNANLNSAATALANTGANIIGSGGGDITTGNATANANIVNLANLTLIGNNWVFEVINVFGEWIGNLIVPAEGTIQGSSGPSFSSVDVTNNNNADIENNANTGTNTGANILTNASGSSGIATGNATSSSDVQTVADTTIVKDNWFFLMVNNMGNWVGAVVGWTKDAQEGATQTYQYDFIPAENLGDQILGALHILNQNNATITNDATAVANTGSNIINGDGTITTGNANALSNIFNFVNASIVGNNWIFGIVNIMGTWKGNLIFSSGGDQTGTDDQSEGNNDENNGGNETNTDGTINNNQEPQESTESLLTEEEANPKIKIARSTNLPTARSGETISNAILVENNGDSQLHDINITDTIYDPQNNKLGSFTWPIGTLDEGQRYLIQYDLTVNNDIVPGTYTFKARADARTILDDKIKSRLAALGINLLTGHIGYAPPSQNQKNTGMLQDAPTAGDTESNTENIDTNQEEAQVLGEATQKTEPNLPLLATSAFALLLSSASAVFVKKRMFRKYPVFGFRARKLSTRLTIF